DVFLAQLRVRMGGVVSVNELREAQGAGHARGPAADNHNVSFHLRAFNVRERLAEDEHWNRQVSRFQGFKVSRVSRFHRLTAPSAKPAVAGTSALSRTSAHSKLFEFSSKLYAHIETLKPVKL